MDPCSFQDLFKQGSLVFGPIARGILEDQQDGDQHALPYERAPNQCFDGWGRCTFNSKVVPVFVLDIEYDASRFSMP